ncbi:MAG: UvrD-helicase domain-containing protein, partial [Chloroflexi bacterium]|nr:UvrD-helicase domain-containing protein [Chloroflexota bacterium]
MLNPHDQTILSGLNPPQREAVQAIDGPVLVVAGPGSGKTRVITHRIAYLIRVCGVSPYAMMAVTFTNKAANEMKERLVRLLGDRADHLTIGTFHAICVRILRREGEHLGLDSRFVIFDDDDQISLIKQAFKDLSLDERRVTPRSVLAAISRAKNQMVTPEQLRTRAGTYFEEVVSRVYSRYRDLLWSNTALDFDDLLTWTIELWEANPAVRSRYQERYVHVLVDEFQDTSPVQYALVKTLAGRHRNVCVVGDADQSIYSWRSADVRNMLAFQKDFPDARLIKLEQNYRSTQTILTAADRLIELNTQRIPRTLFTENGRGEPIRLLEAYDEREEGTQIVREIERLSAGDYHPRDCAVLYRTNAQSRAIEEAFIRYGIPYRLVSGTRFYQRKEIKDAIAYLRLIQNPHDSLSLQRIVNVPPRGIGEKTVDKLLNAALRHDVSVTTVLERVRGGGEEDAGQDGPAFEGATKRRLVEFLALIEDFRARRDELGIVDLLDYVLTRSGYREALADGSREGEERWENLLELRNVAREFADLAPAVALAALLERVALVAEVDAYDGEVDAVTLITLHAAKGLEFPVVFLAGMEEGTLPHSRSLDDPNQMEEERRLCYVGITRAKDQLYLSRASRRALYGTGAPREPSRFLDDIPRDLIWGSGGRGR